MRDLLNRFAFNVTSQYGEDGILHYLLTHLNEVPTVCCEFGAGDGRHLSNTNRLWNDLGWTAILIEVTAERCRQIREHIHDKDVFVLWETVTISGEHSLDAIFREHGFKPEIGVLSVDIDSCDYHVWRCMNYVNPWVVVIEHNPTIPAHIEYFDPEDEVYFLCSVGALAALGSSKGYRLVCCTRSNSFFVRSDLFSPEHFPDKTAVELFSPIHQRRCIIDSYSTWRSGGKNRYPAFFGTRNPSWHVLKAARYVEAKLHHRPFLPPSERIRGRALSAGIHCV